MEFKQYDLDTVRVVMVENPDGAYVDVSEARKLVRRILELEGENKSLKGQLGLSESISEPTIGANDFPIRTDQVFFR